MSIRYVSAEFLLVWICFRKRSRIFDMFPQAVRQRDYIFHCLGACGDGLFDVKGRRKIGAKAQ